VAAREFVSEGHEVAAREFVSEGHEVAAREFVSEGHEVAAREFSNGSRRRYGKMVRDYAFTTIPWVLAMMACASSEVVQSASESRLYVGPQFVVPGGTAEAVLVDPAGRIERVFEVAPEMNEAARWLRVPLPGVLALPGLVDAHLHVTWIGRTREQLDLQGATSPTAVRERLNDFASAHPDIAVIVGHGWDQTLWGNAFPTAADLGELARPVILTRVDGHAVWLNAAAMAHAKAFFDAPPATPGMHIEASNGSATGVVIDPVQALWDLVTPAPTDIELTRWITNGLSACAEVGLVEVHDMATSPAELAVMQRLASAGRLAVRVVVYVDDSDASFAWLAAHPAGAPQILGPDLQVAGMKLFADGALGSRGAALKEDYSDMHGHRGLPTGPEALRKKAMRAAELGYPVAIHAIGDLGNEHALAAIEGAESVTRGPSARPLVHRIEHAQVLDLKDLDRFVTTRAVASMQPTHATSDMRWAEARVGPERIKGAYAWNTILHRGIPLAFGSDAPVESQDPLAGLFAAVFRQTASGEPPGGWRPSEALSFDEALAGFTSGAVAAAPGAGRTGRIEVGAPFAVTLLDQDVRRDPRRLATAKVVAIVRGDAQ